MTTAVLLIVLGTLLRFAPHEPNAVPMMALALYAGARLPRRWAAIVPLAAMIASDLWIDRGSGRPLFTLDRVAVYACFALMPLAGRFLKDGTSPMARMGVTFGASAAFFLVTNFASWASPDHAMYPRTLQGLAECYVMGLPFFRNGLVADLIGIAVLFALDGLAQRLTDRVRARPLAAE